MNISYDERPVLVEGKGASGLELSHASYALGWRQQDIGNMTVILMPDDHIKRWPFAAFTLGVHCASFDVGGNVVVTASTYAEPYSKVIYNNMSIREGDSHFNVINDCIWMALAQLQMTTS